MSKVYDKKDILKIIEKVDGKKDAEKRFRRLVDRGILVKVEEEKDGEK